MSTLKTLTIVAALLAGGTSLALAQNGPATGGQSPVAGGGNGGWYPGYGYGYGYPAAPLYSYAAPAYAAPLIYAPPVYAVPASLYGYYSYGYPVGSREWVIERGW